jgi:PX domain
MDHGKLVTFFRIVVKLGTRRWELWKRYSQFETLDSELRPKYP